MRGGFVYWITIGPTIPAHNDLSKVGRFFDRIGNSSDYFGHSVLREKKITASSLHHDDGGAKLRTRGRNGPVMKIVKN
jgi:hypothetical protein